MPREPQPTTVTTQENDAQAAARSEAAKKAAATRAANAAAAKAQASAQPSNPVIHPPKVKNIDANEFVATDLGSVVLDDFGALDDKSEAIDIQIEQDLASQGNRLETLAFNEEILTIEIAESNDENDEKYVYLSVNGRGPGPGGLKYVPRGLPVDMPRKYVEVLCRARPVSYGSVERVNAAGDREIHYPKASGLRYPFAVINDPNPKGRAWLQQMLRSDR